MDTNDNIKTVKEKIEAICKEYNVALMPVVVHQGDRTFSTIDIVPTTAFKQQDEQSSSDTASE